MERWLAAEPSSLRHKMNSKSWIGFLFQRIFYGYFFFSRQLHFLRSSTSPRHLYRTYKLTNSGVFFVYFLILLRVYFFCATYFSRGFHSLHSPKMQRENSWHTWQEDKWVAIHFSTSILDIHTYERLHITREVLNFQNFQHFSHNLSLRLNVYLVTYTRILFQLFNWN